jgi:hypothetical protein
MASLSGTAIVGPSQTQELQDIEIDFPTPTPFQSSPVVVATALQDPTYTPTSLTDTFAVTVTKVQPAGFLVNVVRVDAATGWDQKLLVAYIATGS